jgi:hypothetical protein
VAEVAVICECAVLCGPGLVTATSRQICPRRRQPRIPELPERASDIINRGPNHSPLPACIGPGKHGPVAGSSSLSDRAHTLHTYSRLVLHLDSPSMGPSTVAAALTAHVSWASPSTGWAAV